MSVSYQPVIWNRTKLIYDAVLATAIIAYILLFLKLGPILSPAMAETNVPILRMRAFGSLAFILLTVVLCIGPLARLDVRFMPLLYNRRHFGVMTAIIAATHAYYVLAWYFAFSPTPQVQALFTSNTSFGSVAGFPFELFGVFALLVLAVLAATSHDFWLSFLSPPLWKAIHMSVYFAYVSVVLHVALGALADGKNLALGVMLFLGLGTVTTLHLVTGRRERAADKVGSPLVDGSGWIDVGEVTEIIENRAIIGAMPDGERIAVFKSKGNLYAISNVCSHQNGPVGEGKVVRGTVTCPWHGYQYNLEDGCSPPPFKERIRKYNLTLSGSRVLVDPVPLPLGTRVTPVAIPAGFLSEPLAKTETR